MSCKKFTSCFKHILFTKNIGIVITIKKGTLEFIYLGFYVAFNTVQVISRRVIGRAEETSTYSSSGFCTVHCQPMASNYQLSHLRPCQESNPGLRGGRRECYNSASVAPGTLESGNIVRKSYKAAENLSFSWFKLGSKLCCHVY